MSQKQDSSVAERTLKEIELLGNSAFLGCISEVIVKHDPKGDNLLFVLEWLKQNFGLRTDGVNFIKDQLRIARKREAEA